MTRNLRPIKKKKDRKNMDVIKNEGALFHPVVKQVDLPNPERL